MITSLNYNLKDIKNINYVPSKQILIKPQILNKEKGFNVKNVNKNVNEYSLKENSFDPFKSSPPNDFMNKLKKRIDTFCYLDIKNNNFENV